MGHLLPFDDGRTCVPGCRACLAFNAVTNLAFVYEDLGDTATADVLYRIADDAGGKTPLGQQLQTLLLGDADAA